jgi:RNA polymerase sigma-70 factor, ECF subfamily
VSGNYSKTNLTPVALEKSDDLEKSVAMSPMYELQAPANLLLLAPGQMRASEPPDEMTAKRQFEAELVGQVLEGNRDNFGKLYALYAPLVHGILLARVPRSEVDDLVQDIFLHALKKLHTLRDRGAFGPWISMIARNRAVDFYRGSRETVEVTEELKTTGPAGPAARGAAEVLEVIRNLPDSYRETLVLRLVEGMTGPEIASRTGLTPESVRVNLHRGMKMLRQKLGLTEVV